MAERSMFWNTTGTGDGPSGGFTQSNWVDMLRRLFTPDIESTAGVLLVGNKLAVSGSTSPLSVASGAAIAYGFYYENTAPVSLAVTTPINGTTGGHVVVEADWPTQLVRVKAIRNTDGVSSIPALTQTANTKWQIRLASFTITTGGAITLTDGRAYARAAWESDKAALRNIGDGRIVYGDTLGNGTSSARLTYTEDISGPIVAKISLSSGQYAEVMDQSDSANAYLRIDKYATGTAQPVIDLTATPADLTKKGSVRIGRWYGNGTILGLYYTSIATISFDSATGVATINPQSATPPFVIGANGQGQKVIGLNSDQVDGIHFSAIGAAKRVPFASATNNFTTVSDFEYDDSVKAVIVGQQFHFRHISDGQAQINKYAAGGASLDLNVWPGTTADDANIRFARSTVVAAGNVLSQWFKGDGTATVTAQIDQKAGVLTINPQSATAPLIIGASGQGVLVTGLNADKVDGFDAPFSASALASNSVTTVKILDANVTTAKIADANVTTAKIADDAVTSAKIAAGAVDTTALGAQAVTAAKLGSDVAGNGLGGGSGAALAVNVDGATIEISSDSIRVKDAGITAAKLAAAVAGNGLTGGAGSALAVNVDNATLTISSDIVKVQDGGITATQLGTGAVTNTKIANQAVDYTKVQSIFALAQLHKHSTDPNWDWPGFFGTLPLAITMEMGTLDLTFDGTTIYTNSQHVTFANAFAARPQLWFQRKFLSGHPINVDMFAITADASSFDVQGQTNEGYIPSAGQVIRVQWIAFGPQ